MGGHDNKKELIIISKPTNPAPSPITPFTPYEKENKIFPHFETDEIKRRISGAKNTEIFALDLQLRLKEIGYDYPVCYTTKPNLGALVYYYIHETPEDKSEFFECRSEEIEFPHIHFMTYSAGAFNRPEQVQEAIPNVVASIDNYHMVRRITETDPMKSITEMREPVFFFKIPDGDKDFVVNGKAIFDYCKTNTELLAKIEPCFASERGFSLPMNDETRERQLAYYGEGGVPPYKDARYVEIAGHSRLVWGIRNWKNSWTDGEFISLRTAFELNGVMTFTTLSGLLNHEFGDGK